MIKRDRDTLDKYQIRKINSSIKISIESFSAIPETRFIPTNFKCQIHLFNIWGSPVPEEIFEDLISLETKLQDLANEVNAKYSKKLKTLNDEDTEIDLAAHLKIWKEISKETFPSNTLKYLRDHFNDRKKNF